MPERKKADLQATKDNKTAMTRTAYQNIIHSVDPKVNAAGVEASMRLQFGTLDHLSRKDFKTEIGIAKQCEEAEPGFLERCAKSYGYADQFSAEGRRLIETVAYRLAAELRPNGAKPLPEDADTLTLRVFEDDRRILRAGLYPKNQADSKDDWNKGWPLTDCTDTHLVIGAGCATRTEQADAVLAIAYGRLFDDRKLLDTHIEVPARLTPWAVNMFPPASDQAPGDQPQRVYVMAMSEVTAKAAAEAKVIDLMRRTATARRLE